jgi:hypothetical protein
MVRTAKMNTVQPDGTLNSSYDNNLRKHLDFWKVEERVSCVELCKWLECTQEQK